MTPLTLNMIHIIYKHTRKAIAIVIGAAFIITSINFPADAQDFSINLLPMPGAMVSESVPFSPLALKGLVVDLKNPLDFQFILDTGNSLSKNGNPQQEQLKNASMRLIKYFLAGLTVPQEDLWVNLSPYEKNRIVPQALGTTELGRDLLAQDYILKQLTASLIYPEKDLGREFWNRVYAQAQKQFGTTNIPVNTFNKVWILPNEAQVFENINAAYITKSSLKVMMDEDYLSIQKHNVEAQKEYASAKLSNREYFMASPLNPEGSPLLNSKKQGILNGVSTNINIDSFGSQIIRAIILPEIEKEVNQGKNFAPLRQIYQALILAKWYKQTIQNSLLDALYMNKDRIAGINLKDPAVKEKIYARYLQAYKKGVFNYIKEDSVDALSLRGGSADETILKRTAMPRKYFSGGTEMATIRIKTHHTKAMITPPVGRTLIVNAMLAEMPATKRTESPPVPEAASTHQNTPQETLRSSPVASIPLPRRSREGMTTEYFNKLKLKTGMHVVVDYYITGSVEETEYQSIGTIIGLDKKQGFLTLSVPGGHETFLVGEREAGAKKPLRISEIKEIKPHSILSKLRSFLPAKKALSPGAKSPQEIKEEMEKQKLFAKAVKKGAFAEGQHVVYYKVGPNETNNTIRQILNLNYTQIPDLIVQYPRKFRYKLTSHIPLLDPNDKPTNVPTGTLILLPALDEFQFTAHAGETIRDLSNNLFDPREWQGMTELFEINGSKIIDETAPLEEGTPITLYAHVSRKEHVESWIKKRTPDESQKEIESAKKVALQNAYYWSFPPTFSSNKTFYTVGTNETWQSIYVRLGLTYQTLIGHYASFPDSSAQKYASRLAFDRQNLEENAPEGTIIFFPELEEVHFKALEGETFKELAYRIFANAELAERFILKNPSDIEYYTDWHKLKRGTPVYLYLDATLKQIFKAWDENDEAQRERELINQAIHDGALEPGQQASIYKVGPHESAGRICSHLGLTVKNLDGIHAKFPDNSSKRSLNRISINDTPPFDFMIEEGTLILLPNFYEVSFEALPRDRVDFLARSLFRDPEGANRFIFEGAGSSNEFTEKTSIRMYLDSSLKKVFDAWIARRLEIQQLPGAPTVNPAMLAKINTGGIDLNQILVKHGGKVVIVQFDPAQLTAFLRDGFEGFTPKITAMRFVKSPLTVLGVY